MLCPYCNKRPRKKETCGDPECQVKHNRKLNKKWYQDFRETNNESYRKGFRHCAKFDRQVATV